jgi:DNA polymerase-3 subunit epsilon
MNYLFLDTEATGFPSKSKPLDHEDQPYIMELAWKLVDQGGEELRTYSSFVQCPVDPHPKALEVHKITKDFANEYGQRSIDVLDQLEDAMKLADALVAHQVTFDLQMINIMAERHASVTLPALHNICTMQMAKDLGLSSTALASVYHYFTGAPLKNAHRAMTDVEACQTIFFRMKALQ